MKVLWLILLVSFAVPAQAQISYTGHYGDKETRKSLLERTPGIKVSKDESGFQSDLVIVHLKDNQYKFWLSISKGYPAYHTGDIEGLINIVKDTAIFLEDDKAIGITCKLVFLFTKNNVEIKQNIEDNCGFGAGVHAAGDYPLISSRPTITDITKMYMTDMPAHTVIVEKSILYEHATDTKPSTKYFIKGDKVYGEVEEGDLLFVRYMSKAGKYTEGWIKKSTVN
jgi:hypothetical protein